MEILSLVESPLSGDDMYSLDARLRGHDEFSESI